MRIKNASRRLGVDTVANFAPYAAKFRDNGYRTVMRYLNREHNNEPIEYWKKPLSRKEMDRILNIGMDIGFVQFSAKDDRDLSISHAREIANNAVLNLKDLGVPSGVTIFCDTEWQFDVNKQDQFDYISNYSKEIYFSDNICGLYVDRGLKFDSYELYHLFPYISAYWISASITPTVDKRGAQIVQSVEYKGSYSIHGLRCDVNMFCVDGKGSYCQVISK